MTCSPASGRLWLATSPRWAAVSAFWQKLQARTAAMTAQEMTDFIPQGITTWSARRALRCMLEHNWEHLEEIRFRLDSQSNPNREIDN